MDKISDMLTRIRNSQAAGHNSVSFYYSKFREAVMDVLLREGYVRSFKVVDHSHDKKEINVSLKYLKDGNPVIQEIHRVSKPGRRVYSKIADCRDYYNGLGTVVLSTSKGVMSLGDARKLSLGGEVICKLF